MAGECAMLNNVRSVVRGTTRFAGRTAHLGGSRDARSFLLAVALLCSITPAKAEYRLHVGDSIEISVARVPELKQRVPVQLVGNYLVSAAGNAASRGLVACGGAGDARGLSAANVGRARGLPSDRAG